MSRLPLILLACMCALNLYASVIPQGSSVEIKPLVHTYTVVQELENSTDELSRKGSAMVVQNEEEGAGEKDEETNTTTSSQTKTKDKSIEAVYDDSIKHTTSSSTDTLKIEKEMHSHEMTSAIESALHESNIPMSHTGDYVLSGYIKAMRCSKPKLVSDGSKTRYSLVATTTIHVKIAHKTTGNVVFAKTLSGSGQQTYNINNDAPVDDVIDLSIEDLRAKLIEALGGKKSTQDEDYQDSPGKRLKD